MNKSQELVENEEVPRFYKKDVDLILKKKPSALSEFEKGSEERSQEHRAGELFQEEHSAITKVFCFHFPLLSNGGGDFVSIEIKVPIDQLVSSVIEVILREFLLYFLRNSLPLYEYNTNHILHPAFKNGLPKTHYPSLDPNQVLAKTGISRFILLPSNINLKEAGDTHECLILSFKKAVQLIQAQAPKESQKESGAVRKRCASDCSPPTTSEETGLGKLMVQRNKSHAVRDGKQEGSSKEFDSNRIAQISYSASSLIRISEPSLKRKPSRNSNNKEKARSSSSFVNFFFSCMTDSNCSK